ncbi:radical SAM/SPASM domain-containing protein [Limimaricola sp. AA108-03]|uniref:radical SAM protein n=1 Tax=Limimaricola sp. AA108-03 TaxID=3425945 RepID=UPI003D774668
MVNSNRIERQVKKALRGSPLYAPVKLLREQMRIAHFSLAQVTDKVVRPAPHEVFLSLTANCNLRCGACSYGRDFMPSHQLPWEVGAKLIDDCKELGIGTIRLYGGEPLLHRDLDKYVERIAHHGLNMYVTTNGLLLDKKIDRLVEAGLKRVSIGFYGLEEDYDAYVQRPGAFEALSRSLAATRSRHGADTLPMGLDWLLMRSTGRPDSVRRTLQFARDHQMQVYINLIHYSLPYFVRPEHESEQRFWFEEEDRPILEEVASILLEEKQRDPGLIRNTERGIRSIPDWLIRKSAMRLPCTSHDMLWIGPDGTVQMCFVTFKLGSLHEHRLSELLFNERHRSFARHAFNLKCPNCNCGYDKRVNLHRPSRAAYAAGMNG